MAEVHIQPSELERRRKISVALTGTRPSEESRRRMSEAQRNRTETHRRRLSESNRGKYRGQKVVDPKGDYVTLATQTGHSVARGSRLEEHRKVLFDKIGPGTHPCHWRDVYGCGKNSLEWGSISGICADHLDGDKRNNHPDNLVPSCNSCNLRRGRLGHLVSRDVVEISKMYSQAFQQKEIAARYGIAQSMVSRIVNRKTWKEVR